MKKTGLVIVLVVVITYIYINNNNKINSEFIFSKIETNKAIGHSKKEKAVTDDLFRDYSKNKLIDIISNCNNNSQNTYNYRDEKLINKINKILHYDTKSYLSYVNIHFEDNNRERFRLRYFTKSGIKTLLYIKEDNLSGFPEILKKIENPTINKIKSYYKDKEIIRVEQGYEFKTPKNIDIYLEKINNKVSNLSIQIGDFKYLCDYKPY